MINNISFKSKFGLISIVEKDKKISSIFFGKVKNKGKSKILIKMKKDINDFFNQKKKNIKTKIIFKGSKLQIKIWRELYKIPYGKTKSYQEIAKKVNTSPRYVGNVCGQNKHLILIPCHRVVRSDGKLGGFSAPGGVKTKKKLLNLEKSY